MLFSLFFRQYVLKNFFVRVTNLLNNRLFLFLRLFIRNSYSCWRLWTSGLFSPFCLLYNSRLFSNSSFWLFSNIVQKWIVLLLSSCIFYFKLVIFFGYMTNNFRSILSDLYILILSVNVFLPICIWFRRIIISFWSCFLELNSSTNMVLSFYYWFFFYFRFWIFTI